MTRDNRMKIGGWVAAALAALLAGCGGGSDTAHEDSTAAAAGSVAESASSPKLSGAPDSAAAKERLLFNANVTMPDAARLVAYTETGVDFDGPEGMESAIVRYEAELEFTADTYFLAEHKAGDRVLVQGEIEYLNENGNWRLLTMGVDPR
jgi:hypothetical protein